MNEVKDSCHKHYFAHTLEGRPPKDWQSLEAHLKNVAELARSWTTRWKIGFGGKDGQTDVM